MEPVAASTGGEELGNLAPHDSSSTPPFCHPNVSLNFNVITTNLPLPHSTSNTSIASPPSHTKTEAAPRESSWVDAGGQGGHLGHRNRWIHSGGGRSRLRQRRVPVQDGWHPKARRSYGGWPRRGACAEGCKGEGRGCGVAQLPGGRCDYLPKCRGRRGCRRGGHGGGGAAGGRRREEEV